MLEEGGTSSGSVKRLKLVQVKLASSTFQRFLGAAGEGGDGCLDRGFDGREAQAVSGEPNAGPHSLPPADIAELQLTADPERSRICRNQGAIEVEEGDGHASTLTNDVCQSHAQNPPIRYDPRILRVRSADEWNRQRWAGSACQCPARGRGQGNPPGDAGEDPSVRR